MADVPISGAIDPSAFPFLLIDLHRNGATGSLKVAGPSYQKALYFRAGRILFGSSNDPRDQLGAILIESGKITPEQLEEVNSKVGPGSPLAKVLTETGFVNQRELSEAARAKVERILSDIVAYEDGTFEFEDGVLPKGAVDLKLSTERVVVAAVRRVTDRNFVLRYIDGMEVVLRGTNDVAVPFAEIETDTSGITHYLDGVRTLKEAASLARLDDFEAAKIACALLFLGAVEKVPVVDLGAVAAAAQGLGATPAIESPPTPAAIPEPEPALQEKAFDETLIISPSEAAPTFGMEAESPTIAMAPGEAPFVLTEPEPPVITPDPEPPTLAFVEPPVAPPPPARRQYDMPPPESPRTVPPPPAPVPVPVAAPVRSEPEVASHPRPSQSDLAALDQILNSPSAGTPLKMPVAAASKTATRPATRPTTSGGGRRSAPSRLPLLAGIAAVLVMAALAGWFFVLRPRGEAAAADNTPTTPVSTVPVVPVDAAPARSDAAVPDPGAAGATPAASAPPAAPTETGARALLQGGSYPEAARAFAADLKAAGRGAATVQLLIACSTETVQKAVENVGVSEIIIVPHRFQGRDCFRLCWGIYPSTQQATAAVPGLPPYFRERGASPRVVRAAEILP